MKEKTRRIFLCILGVVAILLVGIFAVNWIVDGVAPTDIRSWITFLAPFFGIVVAFVLVANSKPKDN